MSLDDDKFYRQMHDLQRLAEQKYVQDEHRRKLQQVYESYQERLSRPAIVDAMMDDKGIYLLDSNGAKISMPTVLLRKLQTLIVMAELTKVVPPEAETP